MSEPADATQDTAAKLARLLGKKGVREALVAAHHHREQVAMSINRTVAFLRARVTQTIISAEAAALKHRR